jgi:uncharacterized integral membrane protein
VASNGGKSQSSTGSGGTAGRSRAKTSGTGTTGRAKSRTSAASAAGATARARIGSSRRPASRAAQAPKSVAEPTTTVPADDAVLAASNTTRALSPDMPRVAWLRTQLHQMEARQREQLVKVAQLTLIAIIFITFVLQNAQGVNVHFLLFALNIRLIWVIFGCAFLGGVAGYLIGRPDKSLRALLPRKDRGRKASA